MTRAKPDRPPPPAGAKGTQTPEPGEHLWTCREGFERDVLEDLARFGKSIAPRTVAPALVASRRSPDLSDSSVNVVFARQAMTVSARIVGKNSGDLDARVTAALRESMQASLGEKPWALHVWVPDSNVGNRLSKSAELLQRSVEQRSPSIDSRWADRRVRTANAARDAGGWLAQVCLAEPTVAYVGGTSAVHALSMHPGGRARMRVSSDAPSRAAMKIEEAFDWLGYGPAAGETCVDLGAAPGGWTYVVLERGARVIAIDPGSMSPALMERRSLQHIRGSAFDYEPREPVDWLLCDMVWRPLEVAALLARWAKKRWSRLVVANIKLPMRGKVEFLERIRSVLATGGWQEVKIRQLYHDREEVTLTAHTMK